MEKCMEVMVGEVTKPVFNHFYMNVPKISSFASFAQLGLYLISKV